MRECLDWFIKNRFDDIHIVYSDNGDYLYDEDMQLIKRSEYDLLEMIKMPDTVDVELCFRIEFINYETDCIEAEIFIYEDDWIQINRDLRLKTLLD